MISAGLQTAVQTVPLNTHKRISSVMRKAAAEVGHVRGEPSWRSTEGSQRLRLNTCQGCGVLTPHRAAEMKHQEGAGWPALFALGLLPAGSEEVASRIMAHGFTGTLAELAIACEGITWTPTD